MHRDTKYYDSYDRLLEVIKTSGRDFDLELIDRAYNFALKSHGEQLRKSGIPYILHPVSVARILVDLGMDNECIVAALLHDVVEDTNVDLKMVEKEFGKEIANLIDGVTKIGKIPYSSREEQQAENIRKMLMAMSDDIRVIIIKLADRLNNMRTLACMPEQKRRDKSRETMEIYAPIAHRLGIRRVKEELEDLSLRYLDPVAYKDIEKSLEMRKSDRESFIELVKSRIKSKVGETIPNVYLAGRVKSINGIYRKHIIQGKMMEEIYDIYAVRVIVDTVNDCYNVLGIVHDMFTPLPNRFKDYISMPKPNMYQSLHTTVIGKEAIPFEIQIRTWDMHYTAEYGIAAHWKYKLGMTSGKASSLDDRLAWIRKMLETQSESDDATDIVKNIKSDLVPEEVFVFTPKGDVISLPSGSTVIDLAYAIHSAIGNKMIGAKVDKRIVPIDYKVKTGQIVEILTTREESHGPNRDWLNIVKTGEARSKIRQWFKKEKREENIAEGKSELQRELKRNSIELPEEDMKQLLDNLVKRQHCQTLDDLYASIGYGGTHVWKLMPKIREDYSKLKKSNNNEIKPEVKNVDYTRKKVSSGVIVEGIDDCLIKFSRCCNPLPGDDIIGFITRGYGVSVHKKTCSNVPLNIKDSEEPERWVNVHWANQVKDEFESTLEIVATDRTSLLADITAQLSSMHIFIHSFNFRHTKDGNAIIYPRVTVNGLEHLKTVMARLSKIDGVISIGRS